MLAQSLPASGCFIFLPLPQAHTNQDKSCYFCAIIFLDIMHGMDCQSLGHCNPPEQCGPESELITFPFYPLSGGRKWIHPGVIQLMLKQF